MALKVGVGKGRGAFICPSGPLLGFQQKAWTCLLGGSTSFTHMRCGCTTQTSALTIASDVGC